MNINQVKYFVSVVDQGSFSAAAAEQFITAQGMSKAIADLENEIGKQLLVRKNRGVVPTEFGKEFYERAKLVKRCFGDLELFARNHPEAPEGAPVLSMLVCAPGFLTMEKVSKSVSAFVKANLGIPVSVSFGLADQCIAALESGEADAVIAIGEVHIPGIECSPIGTIPCGVQISANSPLAQYKYIRLSDLRDLPVAFWPDHDFFNDALKKRLGDRIEELDIVTVEQSVAGLINHAARYGALLVPRITAIDENAMNTTAISFHPDEGLFVSMCLLTYRDNTGPKVMALRRFLTMTNRLLSEANTSDMISRAIAADKGE